MTPDELKTIGAALYPFGWQTRIARDVGVTPRTIRRYVAGHAKIPRPVELHVLRLAGR